MRTLITNIHNTMKTIINKSLLMIPAIRRKKELEGSDVVNNSLKNMFDNCDNELSADDFLASFSDDDEE